MNGETALERVRYYCHDEGVDSYLHLSRALRDYCRKTGFTWMREVNGVVFDFNAGGGRYLLGQMGLRRIDRVWIQETGKWTLLEEYTPETFEEAISAATDDEGNVDRGSPTIFMFARTMGAPGLDILVHPTPDATYAGRIDGIAASPVATRTGELPGPEEYHEDLCLLAAGYHMVHAAERMMLKIQSEGDATKAQMLLQRGRQNVAEAQATLWQAADDDHANRGPWLENAKTPLMR